MTVLGFSLDWLKVTFPYGRDDFRDYQPTTMGGPMKDKKPTPPYSDAVGNRYMTLCWDDRHPEWRVMLEMTGQQLSAYRRDGGSMERLMQFVTAAEGRFTRLDFAVDLFDTGGSPLDFAECFYTSQLMVSAKTISVVQRTGREESQGETVYLGRRSSERMVRVYNKGKQAKMEIDWLRVEIEVKGKRSVQLGDLMAQRGIVPAGKSAIRDFVEWSDIPWFEGIYDESYEHVDIDSIGRPETDRERWLFNVCLPQIAKAVDEGIPGVLAALNAILLQADDRAEHGPSLT